MRTALLFPGQGAPAAAWRGAVSLHRPDLLDLALELLDGADPWERFGSGTEFDQPAVYCASLAAFEIAGRPAAALHAGHSLGELAALACAGALDARDGLRLVVLRGRLTAEAGRGPGSGAMLAVRAGAEEVAPLAARHGVAVANLNSPSQTVLSGAHDEIERLQGELRDAGTLTKLLPVGGAFHSPLMRPAAEGFAAALAEVRFQPPAVPVLSGRTGRPFEDPARELAASLLEPVRWIDVVAALEREGVERCCEIGPGKALTGLVRRAASAPIDLVTTRLPDPAHA